MDLDDLEIASVNATVILTVPGADDEPPPRLTTPVLRERRRAVSQALRQEPADYVLRAASDFEKAAPQEQKWIAYELIRHHKAAFEAITPDQVEDFASRIASWYATDAFGTILSGPLWAKGRLTDAFIEAWSKSPQMWLRRSSLVATVGLNASLPGRRGDPGRTLPICLRLAADREDMIEKAVSWALRYLSQRDREAVVAFMDEHGGEFCARVRREVRNKLRTGLKNPKG